MAKRWKFKQQQQQQEEEQPPPETKANMKDMIEYSIMPYPPKQQSYTQGNVYHKKQMLYEEYNKYLEETANRGYKIGALVQPNYGEPAKITGIKPGNPSIDIWGDKTVPDCFLITRNNATIQCVTGYNENELTLIEEKKE